jgi:hypothetical protein
MTKDIFESIDEMVALLHKQIETYGQMKHALRLAELAGVPPKEFKGMVSTRVIEGPYPMARPWIGVTFVLTVDGAKTEFPLKDVHKDLWPEDILAKYRRYEMRKR